MDQSVMMMMMTATTPSTSSSSNPPMDSRIWRRIPQPLLDRILMFLPPPAFFRFRCVCRRWYSFLYSDNFLQLHLSLAPRHDWLIFFQHEPPKSSYVYSTTAVKETSGYPPSGLLLDTKNNLWYQIPFEAMVPPGLSPAASSGGLLCWASDDAGPKAVLLCNPLTKVVTQLPAATRPRLFPSVGFTVGDSSFSILVAGDDLISPFAVKNLTSEGFHADGTTGFFSPWTTTCQLPRLCNMESGRMVFKDGKFYCMSHTPICVLAYDLVKNEWSKIQAPMRRFLRCPSLVEVNRKLVLVAMVEKSKLNVPRSVRLWELQPSDMTWVEVERMPQQLYAQFAAAEDGRGFECVGQGDVMSVTIQGSHLVLLHDFCRKLWKWAPPCPFVRGGGGGLRGFGFEPRLFTPVVGLLESSSSSAMSFQDFPG